jgi:hypothetical protein
VRRVFALLAFGAGLMLAGCGLATTSGATAPTATSAPVATTLTPPLTPTVTAAPLPTNGPCGFPDCSTPQREGARASCDDATFPPLVKAQIDGSIDIGGSACDGDYLVLNLSHRTCATTGPTPCTNPLGLAFFVAQNGEWQLITYGRPYTCAFVAKHFEQARLPAALCTQALK